MNSKWWCNLVCMIFNRCWVMSFRCCCSCCCWIYQWITIILKSVHVSDPRCVRVCLLHSTAPLAHDIHDSFRSIICSHITFYRYSEMWCMCLFYQLTQVLATIRTATRRRTPYYIYLFSQSKNGYSSDHLARIHLYTIQKEKRRKSAKKGENEMSVQKFCWKRNKNPLYVCH